VAVIAAIELQDELAARECPGQTHRRHRRLGAARNEAQHLDMRHALDDELSELQLCLGRRAKAGTTRCRLCYSGDYARRCVT
jgi:hypothetical protein